MDQIAKQSHPSSIGNTSSVFTVADKYRTMVFKVLSQLVDARLEIIEDTICTAFGDNNAELNAKIIVHNHSFYQDIIFGGSIGGAEAYIDNKWSSPDVTKVIQIMARNQHQLDLLDSKTRWLTKIQNAILSRKNVNSPDGSKKNILAHYDIGNDLYRGFLDPEMQYSSAIYNQNAITLEDAQLNKMALICQRLELQKSDHVIEIGTGWGGLAIYMAQSIGCRVTTTTISDKQYEYTKQRIDKLGLSDRITLLKQDYRHLDGQFDKLVSVEMIEAVGHDYMQGFFETCSSLLKANGKMLIQSITIADSRYEKYRKNIDFIQKYIFPGGCLPSVSVMTSHMAKHTDLVVQEVQDIGLHYARTLHDWNQRFEQSWSSLQKNGYSDRFKRLWHFYFCYCEGAFIERVISTHHIVVRKPRFEGRDYETILDY